VVCAAKVSETVWEMDPNEACSMENGIINGKSNGPRLVGTADNLSFSSLRNKSNQGLVAHTVSSLFRQLLINLQVVILGTKVWLLFLAIPLAIMAQYLGYGRVSVFPWRCYICFFPLIIKSNSSAKIFGICS